MACGSVFGKLTHRPFAQLDGDHPSHVIQYAEYWLFELRNDAEAVNASMSP